MVLKLAFEIIAGFPQPGLCYMSVWHFASYCLHRQNLSLDCKREKAVMTLSAFHSLCLTSIASLRKGMAGVLQEEKNSMEIGNWHPVRKKNLEKLCKCEGVNAEGLLTEKLSPVH